MNKIRVFYQGEFGESVARRVSELAQCEISPVGAREAASLEGSNKAALLLSGLQDESVTQFGEDCREQDIRWTIASLGPSHLRVGPVIDGINAPCFECASSRYYSAPGSAGLAKLENMAQAPSGNRSDFEFSGYLPSMVEMTAAEVLRQLEQNSVEGGFIRKIDLLTSDVIDAIAVPVHACTRCGSGTNPERFTKFLGDDLGHLISETAIDEY